MPTQYVIIKLEVTYRVGLLAMKEGLNLMAKRAKGEGSIYKRSDGRWEGKYTNSLGERCSIYGKTKKEVNEKLRKFTYLNDTSMTNKLSGDIKLDLWFERYIEIKKELVRARSILQIISTYKNHISPYIGDKIMCTITKDDAILIKNIAMKKGLSANSINRILAHGKAMFKFALEEHMIYSNPFNYVSSAKKDAKKRRGLSDEEINQIMTTAYKLDTTYHLMLNTLLLTGIRVGELCALKWNDFSVNFAAITIDESASDRYYGTDTKTQSSRRVVPLAKCLSDAYIELYQKLNPDIDSYVFITCRGGSYYSTLIDKRFKYIRECAAKIYNNNSLLEITPHYLRHTFATRALDNNVNIKEIQELLGHSSSRTTIDVYAHAIDSNKKDTILNIEKSILNKTTNIQSTDTHKRKRLSSIESDL